MPYQVDPREANINIRLYDYLCASDPGFPRDIPVIVADEIARQIDVLEGDGSSPPASAYGICIPPFRQCFVEADTVVEPYGLTQRGVLMQDLTSEFRGKTLQQAIRDAALAGTHWLFMATGYIRSTLQPKAIRGYDGAMLIHIDAQGRCLDDMDAVQVVTAPTSTPAEQLLPAAGLPNHAPYMLKAFAAMHARCPADKVSPPRQARRAAERQGIPALSEYYVLRVQPAYQPQSMSEIGRPSKAQQQRREHLVRGHFKWFGEAGLFGKIPNTMIWIPEHERGSTDIGNIKKDYEV